MSQQVLEKAPAKKAATQSVADRPWKFLSQQSQINRKQTILAFRRSEALPYLPLSEAVPDAGEHVKRFANSESVQKILNTRKEIERLSGEISTAQTSLKEVQDLYQAAVTAGNTAEAKEQCQNTTWQWNINEFEADRSRLKGLLIELYAAAEIGYQNAQEAMSEEAFGENHRKVAEISERLEACMGELLDELSRHDARGRSVTMKFPQLETFVGPKPQTIPSGILGLRNDY